MRRSFSLFRLLIFGFIIYSFAWFWQLFPCSIIHLFWINEDAYHYDDDFSLISALFCWDASVIVSLWFVIACVTEENIQRAPSIASLQSWETKPAEPSSLSRNFFSLEKKDLVKIMQPPGFFHPLTGFEKPNLSTWLTFGSSV